MKKAIAWLACSILLIAAAPVRAAEAAGCDIRQPLDANDWAARCDKEIAREKDAGKRAVLLFARAYAAVEKYQYDDALVDLDAAIAADADCVRCRHERAYVNGELSEYAKAIADLDREIGLSPESAVAYGERAYARGFNGDLVGAYEDRARGAQLTPDSPDTLLSLSEALLWLGQFDQAAEKAQQAQSLAKAAKNAGSLDAATHRLEEITLWRTTSTDKDAGSRCVMKEMGEGDPTTLIGDCTRAFLDAKEGAAKAEALIARSVAWKVLAKASDRALIDQRVAAGLDPASSIHHVNLGFSYLGSSHSWAANREFERAIAIDRGWLALAGRAAARRNLKDPQGAAADALESIKIMPNEPAFWVLGDLAFDAGRKAQAREMYLRVYQMGSRDDGLIERLKEVGIADPEKAALNSQRP